jgi:arginyl-tRNA synthetase
MRDRIAQRVSEVIAALRASGDLAPGPTDVGLDRPKRPEHGDYSTNVALTLAKAAKKPPREIAQTIAARLADGTLLSSAEVAGPGFINLRISDAAWAEALRELAEGEATMYRPNVGGGQRVNVEFVSANPTGPIHVGHGRNAVLGDVLVRILRATGHAVTAEYYWNDRGNQVRLLGETFAYRYRQAKGEAADPPADDNWYRGEYISDEVAKLLARNVPIDVASFESIAIETMKAMIRADLDDLRVSIDHEASERDLVESGKVRAALEALAAKGLVETLDDGAKVFKTTTFGDDKDRVLVKKSGELTYFATDIPYHVDKLDRGNDVLIDVWGADHHGHIPRMKWALQALGRDPDKFEVLLVQMVRVLRGGEVITQSKRAGTFVPVRELFEEVGVGATRYFFLLRRADSQLDFDVELAKKKSLDNPVFYAEYAHARAASILVRASEIGAAPAPWSPAVAAKLGAEEWAVLRLLATYPDLLADAARVREPHRIVYFIQEVAQAFQSYYTRLGRVLDDPILPKRSTRVGDWREKWDWERTGARLLWVSAVRRVLKDALELVGVEPPDRMPKLAGEAEEEASE